MTPSMIISSDLKSMLDDAVHSELFASNLYSTSPTRSSAWATSARKSFSCARARTSWCITKSMSTFKTTWAQWPQFQQSRQ